MAKISKSISLFFQVWIFEKWLMRKKFNNALMVLFGPIFFQTLCAALEFDLFPLLSKEGPLTRDQIEKKLGIEEKPARILLSTLTSIDFLKRKKFRDGTVRYKNTLLADIFLDKNKKTNIVQIVRWYQYICYQPMFYLYDSLKSNKPIGLHQFKGNEPTLYQRLVYQPDLEKIFEDAMQQLSLTANHMLAEFIDLSDRSHLLDVGGGDATNIIALSKKYPNIKATVFDSPTVCKLAEDNIKNHKLENRLGVRPGDCFNDPFPKDVDCILFSHFLDIWDEKQDKFLLRKAFDSLSYGGKVIILEVPTRENERGPLTAVSTSPYFLTIASGKGFMYTAKEYESWLREAGFKKIKFKRLPQEHIAVIATK